MDNNIDYIDAIIEVTQFAINRLGHKQDQPMTWGDFLAALEAKRADEEEEIKRLRLYKLQHPNG